MSEPDAADGSPPEPPVLYARDGAIATITLNRPRVLNAIDSAMVAALHRALDQAEADPEVRVILLNGQGRAFSAGFDLKEAVARGATSPSQWRDILQADFDIILRFWDSPRPTIAAIHGHCIGGGFELALACDLTVAAEGTVMGEPEVRFGSGIVAMLLPCLTGPKQAKALLPTGNDRLSAAAALQMGLVNQVVADDQVLAEAHRLARAIATGSAAAVRLTKQAINRSYDVNGMRQALLQALETDIFIESAGGPERETFDRIRHEQGLKAALAWRQGRGGG